MKPLVVYKSRTGNTRRIADSIAAILEADVLSTEEVKLSHLKSRSLIGFGSGIYYAKVDKEIYELVSRISDKCNVFMFITSGMSSPLMLWLYRFVIKNKFKGFGIDLVGLWNCRGYDKHPLLKWIGISKGHPDETDIESSEEFAMKMRNLDKCNCPSSHRI